MKKTIITLFMLMSIIIMTSCSKNTGESSNVESDIILNQSEIMSGLSSTLASQLEEDTSNIVITQPTFEDLKDIIVRRATFEEVKEKYDLEIYDDGLKGLFRAKINYIPYNVSFDFREYPEEEPGVFKLSGLSAPASILLPQYVNMPIDKIPEVDIEPNEDIYGISFYIYEKSIRFHVDGSQSEHSEC